MSGNVFSFILVSSHTLDACSTYNRYALVLFLRWTFWDAHSNWTDLCTYIPSYVQLVENGTDCGFIPGICHSFTFWVISTFGNRLFHTCTLRNGSLNVNVWALRCACAFDVNVTNCRWVLLQFDYTNNVIQDRFVWKLCRLKHEFCGSRVNISSLYNFSMLILCVEFITSQFRFPYQPYACYGSVYDTNNKTHWNTERNYEWTNHKW